MSNKDYEIEADNGPRFAFSYGKDDKGNLRYISLHIQGADGLDNKLVVFDEKRLAVHNTSEIRKKLASLYNTLSKSMTMAHPTNYGDIFYLLGLKDRMKKVKDSEPIRVDEDDEDDRFLIHG